MALWAAALWLAGVPPLLAVMPIAYFTGPALLLQRRGGFMGGDLGALSLCILAVNALNAFHLAALCVLESHRLFFSSPALYAFVPLSRVVVGLFTQELHAHVAFSSMLALVACVSSTLAPGSGSCLQVPLVIVALLLMELTAVVVLAEGPCGYEEAIMHLGHCRAQHQLCRSQVMQHIDMEREEFSGQLLAIATEGVAGLTAAVQRSSDPVLDMLKSSCATGTKSRAEAERIGQIGKAMKEEVAQILRYRTQAAWARLQARAKEHTRHLREYAADQQATSEAMLRHLRRRMGHSLAQMYEMELEAESSLEQVIQGEVNRAMETADARMDLVRNSAQAMERRVTDTVEVLLSLLRYFRSKGAPPGIVLALPAATLKAATPKAAAPKASSALGDTDGAAEGLRRRSRPLPAIEERDPLGDVLRGEADGEPELAAESSAEPLSTSELTPSIVSDDGHDSQTDTTGASTPGASPVHAGLPRSVEVASSAGTETASDPGAGTGAESGSDTGANEKRRGQPGGVGPAPGAALPTVARTALGRHPLFASRLCYRSDEFFWSWASSRDFRAEADALRQWQRASASKPSARSAPCETSPQEAAALPDAATLHSADGSDVDVTPLMPTSIFIDLSSVDISRSPPLLSESDSDSKGLAESGLA